MANTTKITNFKISDIKEYYYENDLSKNNWQKTIENKSWSAWEQIIRQGPELTPQTIPKYMFKFKAILKFNPFSNFLQFGPAEDIWWTLGGHPGRQRSLKELKINPERTSDHLEENLQICPPQGPHTIPGR